MKELYSACEQYLIEKGIDAYNNPSINVTVVKLEVSEETRTTVYNGLRTNAKVEDARTLCKSQLKRRNFHFTRNNLQIT